MKSILSGKSCIYKCNKILPIDVPIPQIPNLDIQSVQRGSEADEYTMRALGSFGASIQRQTPNVTPFGSLTESIFLPIQFSLIFSISIVFLSLITLFFRIVNINILFLHLGVVLNLNGFAGKFDRKVDVLLVDKMKQEKIQCREQETVMHFNVINTIQRFPMLNKISQVNATFGGRSRKNRYHLFSGVVCFTERFNKPVSGCIKKI